MATGKHQSPKKGLDVQKIVLIAAAAVAIIALIVLAAVFIFGGKQEENHPVPPVFIDPNGEEDDPPEDGKDPNGQGTVTEPTVITVTAADGTAAGDMILEVGQSVELTAAVTPETVTDKPVWASSDEDIVKVEADETGLRATVTAQAAGNAVVSVTVGDTKAEFTVTGEEPPAPEYTNPLTGLACEEDVSLYKPYAVMLNNIKKSTPQVGISQADMIFEIPVEGGITRLMGIYQGFKDADVIGSVRSARPYFINIARGFEAIYIHAGGSDDAYKLLRSGGMTYIDGVNGSGTTFFRDQTRVETMGLAHSLMLDVETVEPYLKKKGESFTHSDTFKAGFTFAEPENLTGEAATSVEAKFSGSKSTFFEYDSATKQYLVSQFDKPMTDGATDEQLAVRNVIVLKMRITRISGDTEGRLKAILTGAGDGWYMCDGVIRKISWMRSSDNAQFVLTDENGDELILAPGVTYFAILPSSGSVMAS